MVVYLHYMVMSQVTERADVSDSQTTSSSRQCNALDSHSLSNPDQIRIDHISLDLRVLFDERVITGTVVLRIAEPRQAYEHQLFLDTMDLTIIGSPQALGPGGDWRPTSFSLGEQEGDRDSILGERLRVDLPSSTQEIRIEYRTGPTAPALQWLLPRQTSGGKHPFLYTQSQSIYARSWLPIQDSPGVRVTYDAKIRTPPGLLALMGAENDAEGETAARNGEYRFRMRQPIPPYLIALAVGDVGFASLGERTGVYAEPALLGVAATEFEDMENMIEVAARLYGPYRWGRFDVLVLPPSFPFGGMENPRLTFLTPTLLTGDKSLLSVVAHELAHSWAGNLVSNATWGDFWLNEGFSVYVERRIVEEVFGRRQADMEAVLGFQSLNKEMEALDERDWIMSVELAGRNPDEGFTEVPYEKGTLFLRRLEQKFGRERFDQFLRSYFDHFAFQSITTEQFFDYLQAKLLGADQELADEVDEWLHQAKLPSSTQVPESRAFREVDNTAREWLEGRLSDLGFGENGWTTHEWLHFLRGLPKNLGSEAMGRLDREYALTSSTNAEILSQWLLLAIENNYEPGLRRLEQFLRSVGRLKFLKPLYGALMLTSEGPAEARRIFNSARSLYHPLAVAEINRLLRP